MNFIPLRTLATFVQSGSRGDARSAFVDALVEWSPRFKTVGQEITSEQLRLFAACFYLPHEEGPEAQELLRDVRAAIGDAHGETARAFRESARQLREFCQRAAELRDRRLFHALSQRIWDLREEIDLLERFLEHARQEPAREFRSDFHLPKTYRGGFVRSLQTLFRQMPDGTFVPAQ